MEPNVANSESSGKKAIKYPDRVHFEAILENMNQGVCLFDGNYRLVVCNQKYIDIYELPNELVTPGAHLKDLLIARIELGNYPDMKPEEYINNRMKVVTDQETTTDIQHMRNGRVVAVGHRPMPDGGWLTTHEDITELYALQKDIRHLAYHDQLTDLPNRVLLSEEINRALQLAQEDQAFALLFLDLDGFKKVNDRNGHSTGDKLLVAAARRLRNCVRSSDTVARLGGDEFAIIQVSTIIPDDAEVLAKRIISELEKPFDIDGKSYTVSVSIGVTFASGRKVTCDELLSEADAAMYSAKRNGGRQHALHPSELPRI